MWRGRSVAVSERHRLVCRRQLDPARLPYRRLVGQRTGEVFEMRLPAGAVKVQPVERQTALLDNEAGLVCHGRQPCLDLRLVRGPGLHRQEEMMRRFADIDASWSRPGADE